MAKKAGVVAAKGKTESASDEIRESVVPDELHPDYIDSGGNASEEGAASSALALCRAVSGRYSLRKVPPILSPISMSVRVDVDRFLPQQLISIEVNRRFPRAHSHAIAEVTSDQCLGPNRRRVEATIGYRDGDASLIPGDRVIFEAQPTVGKGYGSYRLTLVTATGVKKTFDLSLQSSAFDNVHFEVDRVANAGTPVVTYDSGSHPTRPADLPIETLSLATVYRRAGFNVTMSAAASVIPNGDAGANGTWSDSEMHNAMVTYWSRFRDLPQWALWVLFAKQHDMGYSLGGIMFDDIGPNHRQGTAIFRDSFIQDAPAGDPDPAAWARRMEFWCAIHEMGHAFNLAHSWQKALGDPWIPLANEPEARSFMNYPYNVAGGESAFFDDFRYAFSPTELRFMRHAPRRFVKMGAADWFVDHNFEAPSQRAGQEGWRLEVRPNRDANQYAFLEPVKLELKLTNTSGIARAVDHEVLEEGGHVTIVVGRNAANARQLKPFVTRCHQARTQVLKPGQSIYHETLVSANTSGWLIDEPGFYNVQAAVELDGEVIMSNVLRIHVLAPASNEESRVALDYFTEDVGRVLAFDGAPSLEAASDTLREVTSRLPANPAATHATVALTTPRMRTYKALDGAKRGALEIRSKAAAATEPIKAQTAVLCKATDKAADTLGHIDYFAALDRLANVMAREGKDSDARGVLKTSVETMKRRKVLPSVVAATERKLALPAKALLAAAESEALPA